MADDALIEALGIVMREHETRLSAMIETRSAALADRLETRSAALEARIDAKILEVKDGEPGLNQVIIAPHFIGNDDVIEKNQTAYWEAGLWQAIRKTCGSPAKDPNSWKCLVPGIAAVEGRQDWQARETVTVVRMSDGAVHEIRARMLPGILPADFVKRGIRPIADDLLFDGVTQKRARIDDADPAEPGDWEIRTLAGRRGKPGEVKKGDKGEAGAGIKAAFVEHDHGRGVPVMVLELTDGEHVAVDLPSIGGGAGAA